MCGKLGRRIALTDERGLLQILEMDYEMLPVLRRADGCEVTPLDGIFNSIATDS